MGGIDMEHYPFLSFPNGLEITYSDVKKRKNGTEYVTIYFEQPTKAKNGFKSAQFDYPGTGFSNVVGFTKTDMVKLDNHILRAGQMAFDFSKEKTNA